MAGLVGWLGKSLVWFGVCKNVCKTQCSAVQRLQLCKFLRHKRSE